MTARLLLQATSLAITVAGCLLVPLVGMRSLSPLVEPALPKVSNYRGRELTASLGLVWLLWAAGLAAAASAQSVLVEMVRASTADMDPLKWLVMQSAWPMRLGSPVLLVIGAFGFGLVDDLFGDRTAKGFRGHLASLRQGRLTTGALKLLGIGALSAAAGATIVSNSIDARPELQQPGWAGALAWVGTWLLVTLVIALTANLVNLMDLRPGRALKTYALLVSAGFLGIQAGILRRLLQDMGATGGAALPAPWMEWAVATAAGIIVLLGPLVAVWRLDLRERGMLGDAGANAAGALAGYMLASALGLVGLGVAAIFLIVLNAASERVSFTEVIASNRLLSWLDSLGRDRTGAEAGMAAAPPGRAAGAELGKDGGDS